MPQSYAVRRIPGEAGPGLRGVAGGLLHHHPHDYPDGAWTVWIGILAEVLPGELGVEPPADVGGHRYLAPQLDVVLWVRRVDDADADARVAQHVAVLHAPFHRGEQQVTPVAADPHHRGLRAAIGIYCGQDGIVPSVEQPERRIAERDTHGPHISSGHRRRWPQSRTERYGERTPQVPDRGDSWRRRREGGDSGREEGARCAGRRQRRRVRLRLGGIRLGLRL